MRALKKSLMLNFETAYNKLHGVMIQILAGKAFRQLFNGGHRAAKKDREVELGHQARYLAED